MNLCEPLRYFVNLCGIITTQLLYRERLAEETQLSRHRERFTKIILNIVLLLTFCNKDYITYSMNKTIATLCVGGALGIFFFSCHSPKQETLPIESEENFAIPTQMNTPSEVTLVHLEAQKKVEVYVGKQMVTAYIYPDNMEKPVLFPINTLKGTGLTRGWPLEKTPGERVDHPHHIGMWLNYGDVNGLDFWNNSYKVPEERKHKYGTIRHTGIEVMENGETGTLSVTAEWLTHEGEQLLEEATHYQFEGMGDSYQITRTTTLKALEKEVSFTDNKEGMFAIRVTRALEHPESKPQLFTNEHGEPAEEKVVNNEGVTGQYLSSEGITGKTVWGTRAKWMKLGGTIGEESVALIILDHPENVGYPTYWHARGYGLFAANTLGQKALSKGKEELNFKLAPGESTTFQYRVLVTSNEDWNAEKINAAAATFGKD